MTFRIICRFEVSKMAFSFQYDFNPQLALQGHGLTLEPLENRDRNALAEAASDPLIWAGHPSNIRHERAVFDPYFDMLLSSGSALAIRDSDGRMIGCTAYYSDTNVPSRLSVGFTFLVRAHWGGSTNRAVKRLTLGHLFSVKSEAWFHIAPSNHRSQTATMRLGAVFTHEDDIDLGGGSLCWKCYCLTRESWAANERQWKEGH
jgi:RimJ/RimL family protein N-acetyltransferase